MKIIDRLTDSQLDELYAKYNFNNIIIRLEGTTKPFFVIPKLLTIFPSDSSYYHQAYLDKDGRVFSGSYCSPHLKLFTGLTTQEYFDLLVLHINDTELRPRCNQCGKPLEWSGGIPTGYGSHGHWWDESNFHFCSRQHAAEYQFNRSGDYPLTLAYQNSGGTFGHLEGESKLRCWINSRRTAFIQQGDINDPCILYLSRCESGSYKFGATQDLEYRIKVSSMVDYYTNSIILKEDTRINIANIEADIKFNMESISEYFDPSELDRFWKIIDQIIGTDHPYII